MQLKTQYSTFKINRFQGMKEAIGWCGNKIERVCL